MAASWRLYGYETVSKFCSAPPYGTTRGVSTVQRHTSSAQANTLKLCSVAHVAAWTAVGASYQSTYAGALDGFVLGQQNPKMAIQQSGY